MAKRIDVVIDHYSTDLRVIGNLHPAHTDGDGSPVPDELEILRVESLRGDDLTELLNGISDRYAAFLPEHQRRRVGLWYGINEKALARIREIDDAAELETVMTIGAAA